MESRIFSLEEKLQVFKLLKAAGIPRIQVGSFVHPKIVPQMADTDAFIQAIPEADRHLTSALILNEKGLERALASGVGHLSMSVSVSDTHSRKNARRPAAEALDAMTELIRRPCPRVWMSAPACSAPSAACTRAPSPRRPF
jgi:hydroxymethylglutaryl-CoA lyase